MNIAFEYSIDGGATWHDAGPEGITVVGVSRMQVRYLGAPIQQHSGNPASTEREADLLTKLRAVVYAASAVIERWDSPKWKDEPHTAEFINRLRAAVNVASSNSIAAPKLDVEADLPPMPKPECLVPGVYAYRDNHMVAYARLAVLEDRAARTAATSTQAARAQLCKCGKTMEGCAVTSCEHAMDTGLYPSPHSPVGAKEQE